MGSPDKTKIIDTESVSGRSLRYNHGNQTNGHQPDISTPSGADNLFNGRQYGADYLYADDDDESISASPPYGQTQGILNFSQDGSHTGARITHDGRVDINLDGSGRRLSLLLEPAVRGYFRNDDLPPPFSASHEPTPNVSCPALNVVIQLVGSRGDIQPFVALDLELKKAGHRVRIATHPTFQAFVETNGLEFFSIGGDPAELMAFMVKNPGLLPDFHDVMNGEVQRKRRAIRTMMEGCWRSCIEAGNGLEANPSRALRIPRGDPKPFVADAIISNPPAFAHIHCAEKLGVPLHLMFTMPWSATQAFSHPLAKVRSSTVDANVANYISYILIEMMTWQGIGNVVNSFRRKTLGLERIDLTWAPSVVDRLKIPHTYCWSPTLLPKPNDWGSHITVGGFCCLPLGSTYVPPSELMSFLKEGPPPVYIGFGSIVVNDPKTLTTTILDAVRIAGVRAVISRGWCDLAGATSLPPNIFLLDDCPHDWLFNHVCCVVHHGGAGTTAAGLSAGKPTVVVPFFGDQFFWGDMIARAGAGPQPLPYSTLSAVDLAGAIAIAMTPEITANVRALATKMNTERGAEAVARSFHHQLPSGILGCLLAPKRAAAWKYGREEIRLSALAATVLRKQCLIEFKTLELYRPCEYRLDNGPWEPFSGGLLAVSAMVYNVFKGFGEIGSDIGRLATTIESHKGARSESHSTSSSTTGTISQSPTDAKRVGSGTVKGSLRIVKAAVRAPMTFTLAMAQGAHNVPRVWNDKTVRPQSNVTGLGSGLRAAGSELILGTYDGITGLFVQPFIGARDEGLIGAAKGVAKGVVGLPTKFLAAMTGTAGYSLKGLDMQISKALQSSNGDAVVKARIAQGEAEYLEASEAEKNAIINAWHLSVGRKSKTGFHF